MILLCLRVLNIRHIETKNTISATITSSMIAIVGLAGLYLGIVNGLMQNNYWIIIGYILGAGLGTIIGMRLH